MKLLLTVASVLGVALAGCAAQDAQVAKADCKIAPVTTRSAVNKPGPVTELERRHAEAQLRNSEYRRRELERGGLPSNLEDALRDCP
jgi:hypothetical protein